MNLSGSSKRGVGIFSRVMIFLSKIRLPYFWGWAHFWEITVYVAVPCRNRRLFGWIFWSHCCLRSAVSLNFRQGAHMCFVDFRYSCIYEARMSPTLNESSAIQRFKPSNAIKIRNGITFDFYTGLPHIHFWVCTYVLSDSLSNSQGTAKGKQSSILYIMQSLLSYSFYMIWPTLRNAYKMM